jgi:hypothetical protein
MIKPYFIYYNDEMVQKESLYDEYISPPKLTMLYFSGNKKTKTDYLWAYFTSQFELGHASSAYKEER